MLDEKLTSPVLSGDSRGVVIKLPAPRIVTDKFYQLHGLYTDQDSAGWDMTWRSFRASLYHLSLHAGFSDFKGYGPWAKGREVTGATFAVCLVEDLNIANEARNRWPGVLADLAYANYISALRLPDPEGVDDSPLRFAAKLLLSSAGVFRSSGQRLSKDEDKEVGAVAEHTRMKVEEAAKKSRQERKPLLAEAAQEVYSAVASRGSLSEIPFFPYTDAHGKCELFEGKLTEDGRGSGGGGTLLASALAHLGLDQDTTADDPVFVAEAREILTNTETWAAKLARIQGSYETLTAPTRLDSVEFPPGDYGSYQRVRGALAGPIKNIRDQLMLVRNVLDDVSGHESGQQIDTQAVMQVLASGQARSDVFEQLEPTYKEEAWAILIDASKSVATFAHETRGIATCLAEVATKLIKQKNQWAMYAFNNSLQIIKDYDEDYGMVPKARIGGLVQRNSTLLPDALQVAYKSLSKKEAAVRILVVVSDGYPAGYNGIEVKLASVIKDVAKSGIFLIGVGVDSGAIKKYFPVNCVLSTPYEMMKTFAKSYFELSYLF